MNNGYKSQWWSHSSSTTAREETALKEEAAVGLSMGRHIAPSALTHTNFYVVDTLQGSRDRLGSGGKERRLGDTEVCSASLFLLFMEQLLCSRRKVWKKVYLAEPEQHITLRSHKRRLERSRSSQLFCHRYLYGSIMHLWQCIKLTRRWAFQSAVKH